MDFQSPEYRAWVDMRRRCTDPRRPEYNRYGGRGISVCERWSNFKMFLADMGPRPPGRSLDRVDNAGNYEPSNCRWATREEQQQNRRSAKLTPKLVRCIQRRLVSGFSGAETARQIGISPQMVNDIKYGRYWKNVKPDAKFVRFLGVPE